MLDEVLKTIDGRRHQSLEMLKQFLAIPSVSTRPEHQPDMVRCAAWVADQAKAAALEASVMTVEGGHPIVIAKNRHVADLVTVLYAVRGLRDYWDIETKGSMDLQPDMKFAWNYDEDRGRSFLLKKKDASGKPNERYIEQALEELVVAGPRKY